MLVFFTFLLFVFLTFYLSWDICAAILLACLFCHPLDCLLATLRGCNECFWSLCSSLCNCNPSTLQPLLDVTQYCDFCGCLGICKSECQVCDICLQATECLDLAMEISQMLYHWSRLQTNTHTQESVEIIYLLKISKSQLGGKDTNATGLCLTVKASTQNLCQDKTF